MLSSDTSVCVCVLRTGIKPNMRVHHTAKKYIEKYGLDSRYCTLYTFDFHLTFTRTKVHVFLDI